MHRPAVVVVAAAAVAAATIRCSASPHRNCPTGLLTSVVNPARKVSGICPTSPIWAPETLSSGRLRLLRPRPASAPVVAVAAAVVAVVDNAAELTPSHGFHSN